MKIQLPKSTHNWITIIGATISLISLFMIVFLFAISVFLNQGSSYLGLVTFIILPSFLVAGLILIPIGMYRKSRSKEPDKSPGERWPKIDFNDLRTRNAFFIFSIGTTFFLLFSAVGSYEAFHYTESTEFCGTLCHSVMHPEFTAYQNSAHSRVACVDCHVGSGADWYAKSKLSGLYQVYAVLANVYPKPIETPVRNLRPARETCEECHWPEKFYDRKVRSFKHYITDEKNTEWNIDMLMKVSGQHSAGGLNEGIHWHINPNVKIDYIATDYKREMIPWVRYTDLETGEVTIYEDEQFKLDPKMFDSLEVRTMDCMDCHNRPSHNYNPPAFFINQAIASGAIPAELPGIKQLSMEICDKEYSSTDEAHLNIESSIKKYYSENYTNMASPELIARAIEGIKAAFSKNIFPEMRVRWNFYPNHIGHMEFNGCFRCHDNLHVSMDGKSIKNDCNQCHVITAQGSKDNLVVSAMNKPLEFKHPTNIDEAWKDLLCVDCHTGVNP